MSKNIDVLIKNGNVIDPDDKKNFQENHCNT